MSEQPTNNQDNADVSTMSFEKALSELEHIVENLERGDVPLEQSILIYERGEALKKHCDTLLKTAENKVEKIRLNKNNEADGVEPLDPQD
ncbi:MULTISPECIES: exodeoxyribonuclease VII small subunit [unclassified Bartonella]|uniref:exodeoxyribonuclease VII small subunit n=1 Tax=unclassified Bartonella TaxID=2645622 RepID=UPI0015FE1F84|nr:MULTISPECIES: exodeoxyribonuclease VII small subunit [unclassified Bartonella]UXN04317.1 exodeoxyribonuclease VII small subunit [Bartonella sp. HY406]UXN07803.1 exodeoxyribonuclease VII small subunit [Bartonella sp. HY761]